MIFLLLTLFHQIFKLQINLLILFTEPSGQKAFLTMYVTTETHFLLQKKAYKNHAWSCKNVCDALTLFWTTFLFDLALSCIDKYFGFWWALILLPWLLMYSYFVMRGTLWCIFLYLNAKVSQLLLKCYFLLFEPNILLHDIVINKSNDLPS